MIKLKALTVCAAWGRLDKSDDAQIINCEVFELICMLSLVIYCSLTDDGILSRY